MIKGESYARLLTAKFGNRDFGERILANCGRKHLRIAATNRGTGESQFGGEKVQIGETAVLSTNLQAPLSQKSQKTSSIVDAHTRRKSIHKAAFQNRNHHRSSRAPVLVYIEANCSVVGSAQQNHGSVRCGMAQPQLRAEKFGDFHLGLSLTSSSRRQIASKILSLPNPCFIACRTKHSTFCCRASTSGSGCTHL